MSRIEITDAQITAAQAGDQDEMWAIVQAFDPMMTNIIRQSAPSASAVDVEDLLQEARAVLIQHVHDYDSESSTAALSSFVYRAVRRTVQETHVSMTSTITVEPGAALRVKRALWEHSGNVEAAWASVSAEAVGSRNSMSRERFMATVEGLASTESLDAPAGGEDGDGSSLTLADVLADPTTQVTDPIERRDLARWLMTQIPARQALALRAFYGVHMTQQEDRQTCADLGVSGAALRQLRSKGTKSARNVATTHGLAA
ncbi:sigma factor [Streptomyces sp. NPDC059753]|uniref:sigma factor n=1 Tax=Streptomyces sp. NPDC059753 TaxID=3346933 RepID=UPI0036567CEF